MTTRPRLLPAAVLLILSFASQPLWGQIRDGGIDPWNLGKGDWIYYTSMATNKLGRNVASVTNENSLMLFYKSVGVRYIIVKAATSDALFNGSYNFPQFTKHLVDTAHAHGILIFGYNRSYGEDISAEIAISDFVFNQGADGFVWDAESEWESSRPWIGDNGPALAWQLCSAVRSRWPTKFLAHAPFPIISYHSSFPYKEFGYWCDAVMPQIYPYNWTGVKSRPSGGINWTDVNWYNWQGSLAGKSAVIDGQTIYWTNSIKPLAPVNHVYGPNPPNSGVSEIPPEFVMEFVDFLNADPTPQTVGGYKGANFWRADLHGAEQWANIQRSTIGNFTGIVNNIVIDNPHATATGSWASTRTFYNGSSYGNGTDTDLNSFGTNYLTRAQGDGSAWVQFIPDVLVAGEYDVFQWHPYLQNASAAAPHVINHLDGPTTVYANQQTNAGTWSLLGRFNFAGGTAGSIQVLDSVAEPTSVAIADGVKLVYVGPLPAPVIIRQPQSVNVLPGQDATFSVTVTSAPPCFYQWRWHGADLPGATASTYTRAGAQMADEGPYSVVVSNVYGGVTSSDALLTIVTPPVITGQPQAVAAAPGQSVTFSVTAVGTLPLGYQWRRNGTNLLGAVGSTLTIPSVSAASGGAYSVRVNNNYGSVTSADAFLTLLPAGAGDNSFGQSATPAGAGSIVAVAAGAWHTLGLQADGLVKAWGDNSSGQCGDGEPATNVLAIAAGGYHSLAIEATGGVVAWGANGYGQANVPAGLGPVLAIAAGTWHSVALGADGTVAVWGDNSYGQTNQPAGLSEVVAIAAGGNHTLALKADGTVVAWGENTDAEGNAAGQSQVPASLSNVVAIAAGEYHSLAVTTNGKVVAWGDNGYNQCGVPASALSGVVAVAGGGAHSLALKTNGTVVGWGANWSGQCSLSALYFPATAMAAGGYHSVVLPEGSLPVPRLLNPARNGSRFSALVQTLNRKSYALQYKDSLTTTGWTTLPATVGNGGLRMLVDPAATATQRFYRMQQW